MRPHSAAHAYQPTIRKYPFRGGKVLDLEASLQRRILQHGRWYFFYKNNAIPPSWTLNLTDSWGESKTDQFQGRSWRLLLLFFLSLLCFFAFKMAAPIFLFPLRKRLLPRGLHWNFSAPPPDFICQNVLCVPPRSSIREALSRDMVDSLHE